MAKWFKSNRERFIGDSIVPAGEPFKSKVFEGLDKLPSDTCELDPISMLPVNAEEQSTEDGDIDIINDPTNPVGAGIAPPADVLASDAAKALADDMNVNLSDGNITKADVENWIEANTQS
jgi:hypothetical protein